MNKHKIKLLFAVSCYLPSLLAPLRPVVTEDNRLIFESDEADENSNEQNKRVLTEQQAIVVKVLCIISKENNWPQEYISYWAYLALANSNLEAIIILKFMAREKYFSEKSSGQSEPRLQSLLISMEKLVFLNPTIEQILNS